MRAHVRACPRAWPASARCPAVGTIAWSCAVSLLMAAAADSAAASAGRPCPAAGDTPQAFAVVVYGGTAGGVCAAVAAARTLKAKGDARGVALVNPTDHLGGMVSGGLGRTDGGPSGGIAAEFFGKVGGLLFPPSRAERVFDELVANETAIAVFTNCTVATAAQAPGGGSIAALITTAGGRVEAPVFVDASYEGDLMSRAGVSYTVGREANTTYGEPMAGRLHAPPLPGWTCGADWKFGSAPAVSGRGADGKPLPMIQAEAPGGIAPLGGNDSKVQSYNFRLCLTTDKGNWAEIPSPSTYDPAQWELLRRVFAARGHELSLHSFFSCSNVGDNKTDCNNAGGMGTDFVGGSWRWPDAGYDERAWIFHEHKDYTLGLFHFLRSDASVPGPLKHDMAETGLCADEFVDTGNWPHQLYVREARRMVGDFVFTAHDRIAHLTKNDSVCVGDYNIDAHMAERVLLPDGSVTDEGCLSGWARWSKTKLEPFEIPYRVILPKRGESANLLVTAAVSASHVGSGPLRLEPQYMNIGQAAGVAAVLVATGSASTVQSVSVPQLQKILTEQGQRYRK